MIEIICILTFVGKIIRILTLSHDNSSLSSVVFVVMGVRKANLDVVRVLNVVPVARGRWDPLLILDSHGNFDIDVLESGHLLNNFFVHFDGHFNFYGL
jgi:hypothetical protein